MTFYEFCLQYETPQEALSLVKCYENKINYRCRYPIEIENKITKYLQLF
jgi:hypothetical protein